MVNEYLMSEQCKIPFRKFNKKGKSKWQFYDIESDSVFGDTYKSYNGILKEIRKGGFQLKILNNESKRITDK